MRSVQTEASTHHHSRLGASVSCLAVAGTPVTVPCSNPDLAHPSSCLPSLGPVLLPDPLAVAGFGTMKALTPAALTRDSRSLRLPRLAFPAFRPQPRDPSPGRFRSRLSAKGFFRTSPWDSRLATDSRRNRFVSYGLPVRLPLLPTPPRGDAVTFGFGVATNSSMDSHHADKAPSRTHYPPAKPGALWMDVSRSKRLEGTLTRPRFLGPPKGGGATTKVQLIQLLIVNLLVADIASDYM